LNLSETICFHVVMKTLTSSDPFSRSKITITRSDVSLPNNACEKILHRLGMCSYKFYIGEVNRVLSN